MTRRTVTLTGFSVSLNHKWVDVTASLDDDSAPFTLADCEHGVGALQFSPAIYQHGPLPSPSIEDLGAMVREFGAHRGLGEPFDIDTFADGITGASASYHSNRDFIRIWYVSDGKSIMLVSYVCDWESRGVELKESERIVRTVRFNL